MCICAQKPNIHSVFAFFDTVPFHLFIILTCLEAAIAHNIYYFKYMF